MRSKLASNFLLLVCVACCRQSVPPPVDRPPESQTVVSTDNCLIPEFGAYGPTGDDTRDSPQARLLQQSTRSDMEAAIIVLAPGRWKRLGLVRVARDKWALELLDVGLYDTKGGDGLRTPESKWLAIDAPLANDFRSLLLDSLANTRYAKEIGMATGRLDGTRYHFWARSPNTGARAGYAHSPAAGSFLAELNALVELLLNAVQAQRSLADVAAKVRVLQGRRPQQLACEGPLK